MRVSKNSVIANVAGAIAGALRSYDPTNLDTMGVLATYNAVKAILLAKSFLEEDGIDIRVAMSKAEVKVGGTEDEKTFIRFTVMPVCMRTENEVN